MSVNAVAMRKRSRQARIASVVWIAEHWIAMCLLILGSAWLLPFLAPVFMRFGWTQPASLIYSSYSLVCHQMAQRSFFLFGSQPMYSLSQLPVALSGDELANMQALRTFIGNTEMGWKVAWSDRMVYMAGAVWLAGLIFARIRNCHQIHPLKWPYCVLLLLPLGMDGVTHLLSDASGGLFSGFRYENSWLATLTQNTLPTWFYVGDALGSFNAWIRLLSGLCFGIAVVWFSFPYLEQIFGEVMLPLRAKLAWIEGRTSDDIAN